MSTFSVQNSPEMIEVLACPESGQPLTLQSAGEAADQLGVLTARVADGSEPVGATSDVLVRDDGRCAYPIVDGVPVLLVPEMLTSPQDERTFDLSDPKYAEAYEEMSFYVAVAEELPFLPETFDVVYSGGCVHHMTTSLAFPEIARVLKKGGKFVAIDPWRAPFYAIGTKILGKREPEVFCRPLTKERVAPMEGAFAQSRAIQHGTLTRYPLLALNKFGLSSSLSVAWSLTRMDDAVCSVIPGMRGFGSSVALIGQK